ncbi:nitroreductase [Dictyobacter sp. S3.2.2.5]|uniref:Nitroreductase n=1 Tax=Dictyobacter halimunensis TaxID=3026934 RepID=A0ABQ6G455_9CHLR|nr:nitroreductase [Dictyobacter sp. S3.2.2.5]
MALEIPSKPRGLLYLGFMVPRYLYRWHLGWLFGHRMLMITHIGRKSGLRRQNVLEVVRYDPLTRECIVMAGYGVKSDWYRNIQARPAVEVQVGRQCYVPQQRMLSCEETLRLLEEYRRQHPRLLRGLMRVIGYTYDGTSEGLRALSQSLRGVAFRPQ